MKTYNFRDGKAIHMTTEIYRSGGLQYEKVFVERWPNGDYKKIAGGGFVTFENGKSRLDDPSVKVPDDILVRYFDKNIETQYWVYLNGQKMPYRSGFESGTLVDVHTGDKPGVYIWRDGKLQLQREYTQEEKATWENAMKVFQPKDSVKTN
ncbi:MAG: hypothetical protein ACJ77K_01495 [Bacteroidia bacterium]